MTPIPHWSGYFATESGEIWSTKRSTTPYKMKGGRDPDGYHMVCLKLNGQAHYKLVHRLVLETFVGPCPEGMEACHNDGDKSNNQVDNLRWDTHGSNMFDAISHGTTGRGGAKGSKNGSAKLNEEIVLEIRSLYEAEEHNQYELAELFGISQGVISSIILRKNWTHV